MRIGSLFSGIGGLELGLEWAGLGETIWQVEQDEWCRSILAKHWPGARRFEDVRAVGSAELEPVDLICGGFPCQDVSAAGAGAGLAGTRSGLWWEFARIIGDVAPTWVVVENVAGGASRWVDAVRGEMGRIGYESFPIPLRACNVGAPHRRGRIFIVGRATDTDREQLRNIGKRVPRGRADGVRPPGDTITGDNGAARLMADANRGGRKSERLAKHQGEQGAPGGELDGRGSSGRLERGWPGHWEVEPSMGRVAHGPSGKLDRARLKACGNGVVPQCAQVVGDVINILRERHES